MTRSAAEADAIRPLVRPRNSRSRQARHEARSLTTHHFDSVLSASAVVVVSVEEEERLSNLEQKGAMALVPAVSLSESKLLEQA